MWLIVSDFLFAHASNKSAHKRAALAVLKMKNPGGLFSSPGFGSFALLFSGRPIGEPRRNYRYRDNNAYYNDVENKSADAQSDLTARGRQVELAVGTTIGHSIFQSEEIGLPQKGYASIGHRRYIVYLILFIGK
jgi:hypothetical protein